MPHTPHTPGGASHPMTPGGPPSVSSTHNEPVSGSGATPNGSLNNNNVTVGAAAASSSHNSPQTPGTPNNNRLGSSNSMQDSQSQQEQIINSLINSQPTGLVSLNESDLNAELNNFEAGLENNESANDLNVGFQIICALIFNLIEICISASLRRGYIGNSIVSRAAT